MTSNEKTSLICKILSDRKANDIVYIAVEDKTSLCDYFIIAGGRSKTQVKALANVFGRMAKILKDTKIDIFHFLKFISFGSE